MDEAGFRAVSSLSRHCPPQRHTVAGRKPQHSPSPCLYKLRLSNSARQMPAATSSSFRCMAEKGLTKEHACLKISLSLHVNYYKIFALSITGKTDVLTKLMTHWESGLLHQCRPQSCSFGVNCDSLMVRLLLLKT